MKNFPHIYTLAVNRFGSEWRVCEMGMGAIPSNRNHHPILVITETTSGYPLPSWDGLDTSHYIQTKICSNE